MPGRWRHPNQTERRVNKRSRYYKPNTKILRRVDMKSNYQPYERKEG